MKNRTDIATDFIKKSFQQKILIRFLLIYIIITMCSSIVYYSFNRASIRGLSEEYYREILQQMGKAVDERVNKMDTFVRVISASPVIRDYLRYNVLALNPETISDLTLNIQRNTSQFINSMGYYDESLAHLILIRNEQGSSLFPLTTGNLRIDFDNNVRKEEWYQNCLKDGAIHWLGAQNGIIVDGNDYYFAFAKSIKDLDTQSSYGVMYATYKIDKIASEMPKISGKYSVEYCILDEKNNVLLSSGSETKKNKNSFLNEVPESFINGNEEIYNRNINGNNYLIAFHVSSKSQWKVVCVANTNNLYAPLNKTLVYTIIAIFISSVVFYILGTILSKNLTRPVDNIVNVMHMVGQGNLDVRVREYSSDELGYISKTLNAMIIQIGQLIQRVKSEERAIKESEINALQAQINPHFMYNTLNSIKFMAMIKNEENIVNSISALVSILKRSFNYTSVFKSVEDELDTISKFSTIMKIRYNNKFDIDFDVEKAILEMKIFKFMLQPIVENSIIHGIAPKHGFGRVLIKGYSLEGNIIFEVIDDGVGMAEKDMNLYVENKTTSFNSIGLKNIDERIKLYFGQPYGINISSQEGVGTKVTITLPGLNKEVDLYA